MSVLTVESRVRRLLTPDPEALLADIVSEMSDPVLRSEWEARLRKRLDAKEEYAEQDQQVFNAAYGKALELGFDDPGEFARRAVKQAVHERIHAKKVSAIRRALSSLLSTGQIETLLRTRWRPELPALGVGEIRNKTVNT